MKNFYLNAIAAPIIKDLKSKIHKSEKHYDLIQGDYFLHPQYHIK